MKKLIHFTAFFLFTVFFLIACSKKDQLGPVVDPPEQNPVAPLSGLLFDELNEAIARFDPLYLQIVYKDKRTREVIQEEASRLLTELNQNPTSPLVQKALIELYHFNSFTELQKMSNTITYNSEALKKVLHVTDTVLSKENLYQLKQARNAFIKNKINTLEKASQKSSTGLWTDNAAWILDQFHYYSQIGNLEMGLDMDGAVGNECNESCCLEYKGCLISAASNYRSNFVLLGTTLAASGGTLGSLYGSIVPFFGTTALGIGGGVLGGVTGFIQAVNIYMNDQNVCALNYKACIQRRNGN